MLILFVSASNQIILKKSFIFIARAEVVILQKHGTFFRFIDVTLLSLPTYFNRFVIKNIWRILRCIPIHPKIHEFTKKPFA